MCPTLPSLCSTNRGSVFRDSQSQKAMIVLAVEILLVLTFLLELLVAAFFRGRLSWGHRG